MSGWGTIYNTMTSGLTVHSRQLMRLQEQISTGARVNRPSDAPGDAFEILTLQEQLGSISTRLENIDRVDLNLQTCSDTMQEISENVQRIRQLLTQAASDTYGQRDREPVAAEIDSLLEQAVSLVNSPTLGRYSFSGDRVETPPYAVTRDAGGRITAVAYQGGDRNLMTPVLGQVRHAATVVGEDVFRAHGRGEVEFLGETGAAAGAGTSTVRGDVWLSVTDEPTRIADSDVHGIVPAAGAPGDTITGPHTLTLDADAGTLRLDGGPAVAYDAGSTSLRLENAAGDCVYVDASNVDPGLTGTMTIDVSRGLHMSVDDGVTLVPVDPSVTNQAVSDSRTGQILYVDASGVTATGLEPVRATGTYGLFDVLIDTRDLLRNERGLPAAQQSELIGRSIDSLDEAAASVTAALTSIGARQHALGRLAESLRDVEARTSTREAELKDADVVEIATELARTQTFYEMMLTATSKVMNLSLLDFI